MIKVLLIAYACEPNKGSEPGIGWNWAIHLSQYADVTVVTRANNKSAIEEKLRNKSYPNLSFIYFDLPIFAKIKKVIPFGVQFYYLLWEYFVINKIKNLKIDLIQRVTFGSTVSLLRLYKYNIPYIMSFTAGGETSPVGIYKQYSSFYKILEKYRLIYNSAYKYLPITKKLYDRSRLILSVTEETAEFITSLGYKGKIKIVPAIGIETIANKTQNKNIYFNLVYAGRLIYWKNVDILIKSMNGISVKNIVLDIYGDGKEKKKLEKLATGFGLDSFIKFHGNVQRYILLEKMSHSHLFVFASSHDSGGMVILEAVRLGVPVLFLDTGGPKEIFQGIEYPLKVNPDQPYAKIVESFKERIEWFYKNYDSFYDEYSKVRGKILEKYNWDNKAKRMVEIYKEVLNENSASS